MNVKERLRQLEQSGRQPDEEAAARNPRPWQRGGRVKVPAAVTGGGSEPQAKQPAPSSREQGSTPPARRLVPGSIGGADSNADAVQQGAAASSNHVAAHAAKQPRQPQQPQHQAGSNLKAKAEQPEKSSSDAAGLAAYEQLEAGGIKMAAAAPPPEPKQPAAAASKQGSTQPAVAAASAAAGSSRELVSPPELEQGVGKQAAETPRPAQQPAAAASAPLPRQPAQPQPPAKPAAEPASKRLQSEPQPAMAPAARAEQTVPVQSVHLTLVLDVSEAMQGKPLAAVGAGVLSLLGLLQPSDLLTVWTFDGEVRRAIACEAQHFHSQAAGLQVTLLPAGEEAAAVPLYDAVVAAVEDLERQGPRPAVLKPLVVLTAPHDARGPAEPFEARAALLWSPLPGLRPVLMAAGDPEAWADVKQTRTQEVAVAGTGASELAEAFAAARGLLQGMLKEAELLER